MPNGLGGIGLEDNKKKDISQNDHFRLIKELIDVGRGDYVIENIDKLGIQSSKDKLEIAKKLLPRYGSTLISHMDKFDIQDEKDRLELIGKCIAFNSRKVIENLDKLNINNSHFGLEVARQFVLSGDVYSMLRQLEKFKIENSSDRFKLAKQLASTHAYCGILIDKIHRFKIEDPKDRVDLAKKIIEGGRNNYRLISNIDKFDIQDEKDKVDIVKKLIPDSSVFLVRNIEKFKLQEASDMLDISKDIIENISGQLFLANQDIQDEIEVLSIDTGLKLCKDMFQKACNSLKPSDDLAPKIKICKDKISNIERLDRFYKSEKSDVNFFMSLGKDNEDKIIATINSIKEERRKGDARELVEKILFLRDNLDIKIEKNDQLTKLMEELILIRNPNLKQNLMPLVSELIVKNKFDLVEEEIKNNDKKKAYPAINAMVFNKLCLYDDNNKDILSSIRNVFSKNSFLKDSKNVQETMTSLIRLQDLNLSDEIKTGVLKFLIKYPNNINRNFRYIMSIVSLEGTKPLQGITENATLDTLKNTFYEVYNQFIDFGNDEKLKKEYEQFVNKEENLNRNLEERLIIYLSKHKDNEQLVGIIEKFVKTMSDEKKFKEERYNTLLSEHLNELSKIDSEVYKKWSGLKEQFKPVDTNNKAFITDDPIDLLLIGTEIDNSCQHIEIGSMNRCLMGYVMDGKNKAVVIKNDEGRIIARSIIRLLIQDDTEVVMTKERLYKANGVSDNVEDELENMCIEYAKWLGVSLICEKDFEKMAQNMEIFNKYSMKETYTGVLLSKSCIAPYEYTDMGLGDIGDGFFEVEGDQLVYLYKK